MVIEEFDFVCKVYWVVFLVMMYEFYVFLVLCVEGVKVVMLDVDVKLCWSGEFFNEVILVVMVCFVDDVVVEIV